MSRYERDAPTFSYAQPCEKSSNGKHRTTMRHGRFVCSHCGIDASRDEEQATAEPEPEVTG